MIIGGLYFSLYAYRKRNVIRSSENQLYRQLTWLAPAVLVFGIIRLLMSSEPAPDWRVVSTDDGVASAQFPAAPIREEVVDEGEGISVSRVSFVTVLLNDKLNLRLSFSEYPTSSEGVAASEIYEGISASFGEMGFQVARETQVESNVWSVELEQVSGSARIKTKICVMPNGVYRVMATSVDGAHDDERIDPFISSFVIANSTEAEVPKTLP